ncbi:MAG: hypothetical protein H6Q90_5458, partial [Deltaproteobacteria bacterium]|nr:hypothetical protein [Deltaproteobacteria bacterium]
EQAGHRGVEAYVSNSDGSGACQRIIDALGTAGCLKLLAAFEGWVAHFTDDAEAPTDDEIDLFDSELKPAFEAYTRRHADELVRRPLPGFENTSPLVECAAHHAVASGVVSGDDVRRFRRCRLALTAEAQLKLMIEWARAAHGDAAPSERATFDQLVSAAEGDGRWHGEAAHASNAVHIARQAARAAWELKESKSSQGAPSEREVAWCQRLALRNSRPAIRLVIDRLARRGQSEIMLFLEGLTLAHG